MKKTHHEKRMREISKTKIHESVLNFYVSFMQNQNNLKILDFGAGSGLVSKFLAKFPQVKRVIAFDKNETMMRELKSGKKINKVTNGSHDALPFPNKSFDIVICRYAFHHFDNQIKPLKEVYRVLKNRGLFMLSDPILPEHSRDVLNGIYRIREDHFQGYMTYHELIRLLEENGFIPIMIRPYHYRYDTLDKYLEAVEDGIIRFNKQIPDKFCVGLLKRKIIRSWTMVDQEVKEEMRIYGKGNKLSFEYCLVDLIAEKIDDQICKKK